MKALVLLSLCLVCWCKPTTVVNFSPVGNSPGIAPGFAYAFRAPAPLYKPTSVYSGTQSIPPGPLSNHISGPTQTPTILKTQYHSQDQLGQYAFGYVGEASTAHEVRTLDGAVRGSYTYLDANGELQTANYVADNNGFRVEATNLPLAPTAPEVPSMELPEPVKLTPEVKAATAAHLKAVAEIKASRRKPKRATPPKDDLPPAPPPSTKKEVTYKPTPAKKETVIVQVPNKEEYNAPVPLKKVLPDLPPLKVSQVPVPLKVSSPEPINPHPSAIDVLPGPFPFPFAATQAIFVKADSGDLQSLSTVPVTHLAPLPAEGPVPNSILTRVAPAPVWIAPSLLVSQFHDQDELGGYEYRYEGAPSFKHEVHTPDAITQGSYSYIDANGELQTVSYIDDKVFGF